jgi:hypothetical protein
MIKNNRDDFDQCAALVLTLLYKAFPMETDIVVDDLLADPFDEELTDNYFATIRFLQREGFIRYQEFDFGTFRSVVLTAKGLKVLDTFPDKSEETIAQQISNALQDNKAVGNVIRELIKVAVI